MTRTRAGWLLVLGASALALGLQVLAPVGVPLYDGVVVQEPYRFLQPSGDQTGDPGSFSNTLSLDDRGSPVIVAPTTEQPPQAQLIAQRDAFLVPDGVTSINVSITPVGPAAPPPAGSTIAGNVYRFSLTDDSGTLLVPKPCDGCRSLLLRAPDGTENAAIMHLADGTWESVATVHAGMVATYQANPAVLGDYAVVAGPGGSPGDGVDVTLLVLGGGIALVFAAFVGLMFFRARPTSLAPSLPGRARGEGHGGRSSDRTAPGRSVGERVPSKRKGSRRPRSGRPGE